MVVLMRVLTQRLRKSIGSTVSTRPRAVHSVVEDEHSSQIIMSPPLVSLDLPDIWAPNFSHSGQPFIHYRTNGQTAAMIDGKLIAEGIRSRIASEVGRMKNSIDRIPGLAVIMVGQREDSETYVRNKMKACEEAGIKSVLAQLPNNCSEDDVFKTILSFENDQSIHGILVQLPLPNVFQRKDNGDLPDPFNSAMNMMQYHDSLVELLLQHLNEERILNVLSLEKDVDGFHPLNMGDLALRGREPLFIPCTPKGCIELLIRSGFEIMGRKAVVIGRSNIVGLPTFLLLQRHHATVSVVHAFTKNPEEITREADIVVTAAGVPNLVRGSWLKPGAVVIDVGTHPIEDPNHEHGYRLLGDVCYEEAVQVASALTPVPGGVGPMTVAMLLSNTLDAAKRAYDFS